MGTRSKFALKTGIFGLVALVVVGVGYQVWPGEDYTVKLVMPSAAQLAVGSPVWINGFENGAVMDIELRDGLAVVTAGVKERYAPLHDGTTSRVEWHSALGERMLTLYPGPETNPEIPDGGMFKADAVQVEVDEVLSALDEPTRTQLTSMVRQLNDTVSEREPDLNATLKSAGPTVEALGGILEAVGRDGPAIRSLVTQLQDMMAVTAQRQDDIRGTVNNLTDLTGDVAAQQSQLSEGLSELPSTLSTAEETLNQVPAASDATVGLLEDLQPATAQLPAAARSLSPVLQDLRPAVSELRPMLLSAQDLLGRTPGMLDLANGVLPPASQALNTYQPAVSFLRPYTPEAVGWLHNWGQNFAIYDSQGHMWGAVLANVGAQSNDESLVTPPTVEKESAPAPGSTVGQPWHDATGSPVR